MPSFRRPILSCAPTALEQRQSFTYPLGILWRIGPGRDPIEILIAPVSRFLLCPLIASDCGLGTSPSSWQQPRPRARRRRGHVGTSKLAVHRRGMSNGYESYGTQLSSARFLGQPASLVVTEGKSGRILVRGCLVKHVVGLDKVVLMIMAMASLQKIADFVVQRGYVRRG